MSPEQQRIVIAEACGWTEISDWGAGGINGQDPGKLWVGLQVIPDYLNDLNAMHEAVQILDGYMMLKFATELIFVTSGPGTGGSFSHVNATAAQRAEAFLRTIGKWEE